MFLLWCRSGPLERLPHHDVVITGRSIRGSCHFPEKRVRCFCCHTPNTPPWHSVAMKLQEILSRWVGTPTPCAHCSQACMTMHPTCQSGSQALLDIPSLSAVNDTYKHGSRQTEGFSGLFTCGSKTQPIAPCSMSIKRANVACLLTDQYTFTLRPA